MKCRWIFWRKRASELAIAWYTEKKRAEKAEADKAKLVKALENICAWIDSDSCGGVGSVKRYEEARAVLKGAP